jgi:PST family polysaccharide transporter
MTEGIGEFFEEHAESTDLGRQALRGGLISVAIQYGNAVFQIIASIVLARLLSPEDFGLVAIVTVLTSFAPLLIDFGLGDATAQRSTITQSQVSSLFWLSAAIGLAVALVVAACSPLIASLYAEPRLQPIALSIAITFVLSGMSIQHLALLRRTMQFGKIGRIQILGTLAGMVVAIALALCGYGYWALVLRPITNSLSVAVGAWTACRWRPRHPVFDKDVSSMVRFGLNIVGFSVTYTLAKSADRLVLGLVYRPDQVGYYQNAINLYENSIQMGLVQVHRVGSTALSKLQSNPAALRERYQAGLSVVAYFVMPLASILSVTGKDLTVILLGEKWHAAGVLLSVIALKGIFHVIESSQGWLHLSIGTADRWQRWGLVATPVLVGAVLAGLPFGPIGVAAAIVIACMLNSVPSVVYAGRPIGIDAALVIRTVYRQLIGAVATAAGGWWLQTTILPDYPILARVVLAGCFCACIYLAVVVVVFRFVEPIRVIGSIVRDLLGRR